MHELLDYPLSRDSTAAWACWEAENYILPADWRHGRAQRLSLALDTPDSHAEDAFDLTPGQDGEPDVLHVSIADPGSFIYDMPVVLDAARRQIRTEFEVLQSGQEIAHWLLPPWLGRDIFGLWGDRDAPAITGHIPVHRDGTTGMPTYSKEAVVAPQMSPAYADKYRHNGEAGTSALINGLWRVSQVLRHGRRGDFSTIILAPTVAASLAYGRFAPANNIPALFRNTAVPPDLAPELTDPARREKLLNRYSKAFWSHEPTGLIQFGNSAFAPLTSPLRDFRHLVNQCNLAAHLDGRDYPFPEWRIRSIAAWLNRHEKRRANRTQANKHLTNWGEGAFAAAALRERLELPDPKVRDLTVALFEARGAEDELLALRQQAARRLARAPQLAEFVLELAARRDWLQSLAEGTPREDAVLFVDATGRTYATDGETTSERITSAVEYIAQLAGLEDLRPTFYSRTTQRERRRTSPYAAQKKTAAKAIPAAPPSKPRDPKGQLNKGTIAQHPVIQLNNRQVTNGGEQPVYTFDESDPLLCTATITDIDDTSYTATARGRTRDDAKKLTAADLLGQMPKRPHNKREAKRMQQQGGPTAEPTNGKEPED